MPKNTRIGSDLGLAALMSLVADHGDSLHYSLSKRGWVWLTLTHYEGERYATSVELSALSDTGDLRTAAVVVAVVVVGVGVRDGVERVDEGGERAAELVGEARVGGAQQGAALGAEGVGGAQARSDHGGRFYHALRHKPPG